MFLDHFLLSKHAHLRYAIIRSTSIYTIASIIINTIRTNHITQAMGFNSVRLPIGYWNLIQDPYRKYAPSNHRVSLRYIDWCFDMCERVRECSGFSYDVTFCFYLNGRSSKSYIYLKVSFGLFLPLHFFSPPHQHSTSLPLTPFLSPPDRTDSVIGFTRGTR